MSTHKDPALDPAHQHTHEHIHHSPGVVQPEDEPRYTSGTTFDPPLVPVQSPLSSPLAQEKQVELGDVEKGSVGRESASEKNLAGGDPKFKVVIKATYRKLRWLVHLIVFCLFTG